MAKPPAKATTSASTKKSATSAPPAKAKAAAPAPKASAAKAPAKKAPAPPAKVAPVKAATNTSKTPAPATAKSPTAKSSAAKASAATKAKAPTTKDAPAAAPTAVSTFVRKVVPIKPAHVRKASDFDEKFLTAQRQMLITERAALLGQADRLEGEAASLMEDLDPGDVQFDEESGEGDSLSAERDRDLALSAQARQMVADIDAALLRIDDKSYGYSLVSGHPIPKERLEALPWATELVQEKVGGLGSQR